MTQGDRQLLLIDLCARLPYGVRLKHVQGAECELKYINPQTNAVYVSVLNCDFFKTVLEDGQRSISEYKPYLRPISSLNKKEKESLRAERCKDTALYAAVVMRLADGDETASGTAIPHFAEDWCNANHIDYRGMIEKGLAIEAPKDMYKTE